MAGSDVVGHSGRSIGGAVMMAELGARRGTLPRYLTRFVGRESELEELGTLVRQGLARRRPEDVAPPSRLVTLCGPGGFGKTRLAAELARLVRDGCVGDRTTMDSVHWVALGPLRETTQVPRAVAAACGLPATAPGAAMDVVAGLMADRRALVVLDNCEHLLAPCRALVPALLAACPGLVLLVTSRVPLGLPIETLLPVPPLRLASRDANTRASGRCSEASLLFYDRAALGTGAETEPSASVTIEQICERLDGLPLAIELAASWMRVLSPRDLLVEIDRGIDFMSSQSPLVEERHRSLEVVLESTWRRLAVQDQRLLGALSTFAGDVSLEAAEAVGGATLASLSALAEKSLIQRRPEVEHETRYHIHQLIRQHALQRLESQDPAEVDRVRAAHLRYFLALVERAEAAWDSAAEPTWLDRLRADQANIGAALGWALDQRRAEESLRLTAGLFAFWIYTLPPDLYRHRLESALALPWDEGSDSTARARARALNVAGYAAVLGGDCPQALRHFEEGLRLYQRLGEVTSIAWALRGRGHARRVGGCPDPTDDLESLALCRSVGDATGVAWSVYDLGEVAFLRGELDQAERLLEDGLRRLEDQGVSFGVYRALILLGDVHVRRAQWRRALSRYEQALARQRRTHFVARGAEIMDGLAVTAAGLHQFAVAARLLGSAAGWRRTYGVQRDAYDVGAESTARIVGRQLGPSGWWAHYEEGCRLAPERAVDEALQRCQELAASAAAREAQLTERQREVLSALAQGLSNSEIAAQLVLSPRTVHAHLRSIFDKLAVGSRTAAVHRAAELDLL